MQNTPEKNSEIGPQKGFANLAVCFKIELIKTNKKQNQYKTYERKSEEQRTWEKLSALCERWERYEASLEIMGAGRNSDSRTDPDATFMRLKEDHMRNGQLKPAYHVQLAVNSEYITGIEAFPDRMDRRTLKPFFASNGAVSASTI